jgi:serine/threonine-protein kinase
VPLELGATFAHYRVDGLLGRGGMSDVYRAFDLEAQREVALKVLRADNELAQDHDKRFLREARVAAKVRHPNAVTVFDYGEAEGIPYIAMEVVEGRPLTEYLAPGAATLEQKLRWLVDLANALQAAHDARLVHRDVKPENVMVCPDGSVKLLDFGVAKRGKYPGVETTTTGMGPSSFRTAAGVLVGTPLYMSPEQLLEDPLDGRSDQYCWGLLAYELFTGGSARDPNFHPLKYLTEDPRPLDELAPDLPAYVRRTVMRALARNRDARFGTMTEAAHALVGAPPPSNLPPPPRPSSWKLDPSRPSVPELARRTRRRRIWIAAIASVALAATLGVIALVRSAPSATETPAGATTEDSAPSASASETPSAPASSASAPLASSSATSPSPPATGTAAAPISFAITRVTSPDPKLTAPAAALLEPRRDALAACFPVKAMPVRCTLQIRADGGLTRAECGHPPKISHCAATALHGVSFPARKAAASLSFTLDAKR